MLPKFSTLVAKQGNVPSERRFCFILSISPICRSNSWGSVLGTRSSRQQQLCFSAVVRQWVVCSRVNEGNQNQPLCFPLGQRADYLMLFQKDSLQDVPWAWRTNASYSTSVDGVSTHLCRSLLLSARLYAPRRWVKMTADCCLLEIRLFCEFRKGNLLLFWQLIVNFSFSISPPFAV